VRLFGGGATVAIFSIPAHGSTERSLWFQSHGELRFEATHESTQLNEPIDSYVVNGRGGRAEVRVDTAGKVTVRRPPNAR
jgi:hypothetical protein